MQQVTQELNDKEAQVWFITDKEISGDWDAIGWRSV
jgi:hypothetical protein